MSTFWLTLIIAVILVLLAVTSLAIGWLITGKSKIVKGACGMDPHKLRDKQCGTNKIHCELCEEKDQKPLKKQKQKDHEDEDEE